MNRGELDKANLAAAIAIGSTLTGLLFVRAYSLSFTHDESLTYLHGVRPGLTKILAFSYVDANNHPLNTLLTWLSSLAFGNAELALRLPNVVAFVLFFSWNDHWITGTSDSEVRLRSEWETALLPLPGERVVAPQARYSDVVRMGGAHCTCNALLVKLGSKWGAPGNEPTSDLDDAESSRAVDRRTDGLRGTEPGKRKGQVRGVRGLPRPHRIGQ
jgi:hypothetical protein